MMIKKESVNDMLKKAIVIGCAMLAAAGLSACGNDTPSAPSKAVSDTSHQEAKGEKGKSLVVYFSATGNTKRASEIIARETGSTLFEIQPQQPYTQDDLDYLDDGSRSVKEHEDPTIRPAIENEVAEWDSYETIFLGYPIWWGEAPNIVYTFVENHDFTGKRVIPFCTSASSGVGVSDEHLAKAAGKGNWLGGTRFSGGISEKDLVDWAKKY